MDRSYASKFMLIYGCRSDANMIEDELGGDQQHRHTGAMRVMRESNRYCLLKMILPPVDHRA